MYVFSAQPKFMCLYVGVSETDVTNEFVLTLPAVSSMLCLFTWMVCKMGDRRPYNCCIVGSCLNIFFKSAGSIFCCTHLAFSLIISLESRLCFYTVVPMRPQLESNYLSFYQKLDFHMIDHL